MIIKPICFFAVCNFVCTPGAITNIYGRKYGIQGQFSKFVCLLPTRLPPRQDGVDNRDKVYSVANMSEYIRKGYALRKSLKGLKYKKQKKEN